MSTPSFSLSSTLYRDERLDALVAREVIEAGVAPAAVVGWASVDRPIFSVGVAGQTSVDALFDWASVTKSVVALVASRLSAQRFFSLDRAAQDYLPLLGGTGGGAASMEQLLSHRSGLAAHLRLYAPSWQGEVIRRSRMLFAAARAHSQRTEPLYSDLGYLLAGECLVAATGHSLEQLVHEWVAVPLQAELGAARRFWAEGGARWVPTEVQPMRGGLLRGVVHDDNAWAYAGTGLAGHAGAFGTIDALLRFGRALLLGLQGIGPFAGATELVVRSRPGGSLCMGVDRAFGPKSQAGARSGPHTFGHLGFTGTSYWCDPERGVVTALLTNRVYPRRNRRPGEPSIVLARRAVHEALWLEADAAAGAGSSSPSGGARLLPGLSGTTSLVGVSDAPGMRNVEALDC